jgi:hypothetical protein
MLIEIDLQNESMNMEFLNVSSIASTLGTSTISSFTVAVVTGICRSRTWITGFSTCFGIFRAILGGVGTG